MDILISFTASVGVTESLRAVENVAVDVINQSIVLWLKNKKISSPDEDNPINNRDINKRNPPFLGLPGQSAYLSTTSSMKSYESYYDLYLSDNGTPSWYLAVYRLFGKFTEKSESSSPGTYKSIYTVSAEPLYPELPNLHPYYYASLGYSVEGGSATSESSGVNPPSAPYGISESTYKSSYSGRSSSSSSYSSNEGIDYRGKPYSNWRIKISSTTVYFA